MCECKCSKEKQKMLDHIAILEQNISVMKGAMQEFVRRVDDGEIVSVYTYSTFNKILNRIK